MEKSTISWTESTWNPVSGCDEVSPGCDNCYARELAERFRGGPAYPDGFDLTLKPGKLLDPLRWREPRRVFVNSMSDLFHRGIPEDYLDKVFAVMAVAEQHTFQILTKRPDRMKFYCSDSICGHLGQAWERRLTWLQDDLRNESVMKRYRNRVRDIAEMDEGEPWPLPNVWLGVSVEDQRRACRIDVLRETPAAVRFVSFEPLLEEVRFDLTGIDWVIIGGESGNGARPMEEAWVLSLIRQAREAGAAVFVKQLGERWARQWNLRREWPFKTEADGSRTFDIKGERPEFWPEVLRIQEYPRQALVEA